MFALQTGLDWSVAGRGPVGGGVKCVKANDKKNLMETEKTGY